MDTSPPTSRRSLSIVFVRFRAPLHLLVMILVLRAQFYTFGCFFGVFETDEELILVAAAA
jgi:hypothetical protein